MTAGDRSPSVAACEQAVGLIAESAASLEHNPNETLLLQALLVRLGSIGD